MRLLAPARAAMASTRAPPSPLSANSRIAACRICSRVRSGARRAGRTRDRLLAELWSGAGEDSGGIVVRVAAAMNHPDEGEEWREAGILEAADEGRVSVANVDADGACDAGQRGHRQRRRRRCIFGDDRPNLRACAAIASDDEPA